MSNKNAVIIDYRVDKAISNTLTGLGFDVIYSAENMAVSSELSGHPDIQICKCSDNTFICCPTCYDYYVDKLAPYHVNVICGKTQLSSNYPKDIAYNVAWIGDKAIHNLLYTDSYIKKYFRQCHIDMINVSQGYSKCNICTVSHNSVITSDHGIYKTLINYGVDVLLISEGCIDIFGWDHGFIGGASGKINESTLAFFGDVSKHPDYDNIKSFCTKHGVNCISLSNRRLMDLGSLLLVDYASA